MKKLLTHRKKRQLRLAEILIRNGDWVKLKDLSKELNCSNRIIKYDLISFQDIFPDFRIESSHKGIRIISEKNKGFKNLYKNIFDTSNAFQLLEIIFFNDNYSIDELADVLYISPSTLYRLIHIMNEVVKEYGFEVETNPCKISGNEANIRSFYYQLFFEKYTILTWPYDQINQDIIDGLLNFFINHTDFKTDFAYYNISKLVFLVNLTRYKNKHYINVNGFDANLKETLSSLSISDKDTKYFKDRFDLEITKEFLIEILSPMVQDGYSFNYDQLLTKKEIDKKTDNEVNYLSELLIQLSSENDIPLVNKENLILRLYNSIHLENYDPRAVYILYDRNTLFNDGVKKYFPEFYESISKAIRDYRQIFGLEINERVINYMIYTLFVEWENLLPELRKKITKIKVLVLSNRTPSHSYMLKNFLESEYSDYIITDIYKNNFISKNILESLDYDFIVANFPIPDLKTKESIYIENFPTLNEFQKIYEKINEIYRDVYNPY